MENAFIYVSFFSLEVQYSYTINKYINLKKQFVIMVSIILPEVFSVVANSQEISDVKSIWQKLEQKVLDHIDEIGPELDINEKAAYILCGSLSRMYEEFLTRDKDFSIDESINHTLTSFAYKNWEKREKYKTSGSPQTDWEHALDLFSNLCFNMYYSSQNDIRKVA